MSMIRFMFLVAHRVTLVVAFYFLLQHFGRWLNLLLTMMGIYLNTRFDLLCSWKSSRSSRLKYGWVMSNLSLSNTLIAVNVQKRPSQETNGSGHRSVRFYIRQLNQNCLPRFKYFFSLYNEDIGQLTSSSIKVKNRFTILSDSPVLSHRK